MLTLAVAALLPMLAAAQGPDEGCGPRQGLKIVQQTPGAILFSDRGFGAKSSPRRYCLAWKGAMSNVDEPMLVFITPSDGKYPEYPKGGVRLTRLPVDPPADQIPYHVWAYPDVAPDVTWGMYAAVWHVDESKNTADSVRPLLWWGLLRAQSFDSLPADRVNAKIKALKLPPK